MSYPLALLTVLLVCATIGAVRSRGRTRRKRGPSAPRRAGEGSRGVGIGTVRTTDDAITIDVESISGHRFVGRLRPHTPALAALRPGVVLLVTFDPSAREHLSLADDMTAVRTAFDQMLVRKGLVTREQVNLIRHGTRSQGVVTALRTTGTTREGHQEVEIDLMVRRVSGGQFPATETSLITATALRDLCPGCTVDAYYRADDETAVTVCIPPG